MKMVETICESMDRTSLVLAGHSERKYQSDESTDRNESAVSGNVLFKDYSSTDGNFNSSDTLNKSSNSSSEVMEVVASEQNSVVDAHPSNEASDKEENKTSGQIESKMTHIVRKFRAIIDSESEEDDITSMTTNKSKFISIGSQVNQSKTKSKPFRSRLDSDSDDDENPDDNQSAKDELVTSTKSKGFSDLIDSESEDENDNENKCPSTEDHNMNSPAVNEPQKKTKKARSVYKRTGTKRTAKDEAMRQIHSETQRLVREAPVSLPYHRPKQRTLQEFLNRRKVAPAIPQASTTAAKLKMCTAIVNEVVKAKEKEAKLFYKSSDSEDDENLAKSEVAVPSITPAHLSIAETQELLKIDIQDAQDRKQTIQQSSLELGVPRKLFITGINDSSEVQTIDSPVAIPQNDDIIKIQKTECKVGLKEVGVPRKLFNDDFDDSIGGSSKKNDLFTSDSTIQINNTTESTLEDEERVRSSGENHTLQTEIHGNVSKDEENSQTSVILSYKSQEHSEHSPQSKDGQVIDATATQSISNSLSSSVRSEICPIYDTPIISNKETQKPNDESVSSTKSLSEMSKICMENDSQSSELDCGVEGLPLPVFDDYEKDVKSSSITSKNPRKPLINVPTLKPMLRGTPGSLIDFTSDMKPNRNAVNSLVDRFISKHSVVHKHTESNQEVTVIRTETTPEGLKIYKDVLPYGLPAANESLDDPDLNKPGAKLTRLKVELEKKMATKRHEEWKQREQESMVDEEEEDEGVGTGEFEPEEKDEGSAENEETSDTEESEPEENDVLIDDKKRKSCAFGDEEAEVDEDDGMELSAEEDEDGDGDEDEDEDDKDGGKESEDDADEDGVENASRRRKRFSRIVADDDDSNSGEAINDEKVPVQFERKRTDVDMFGDDEDELPVSQQILQPSQLTPVFKTPLTPNNPFNSLDSRRSQLGVRSLEFSRSDFDSKLCSADSQSSDWQSQSDSVEVKNKLFEIQDRHVTDEELMALCSGKFTDGDGNTQSDNHQTFTGLIDSTSREKPVTDSQIFDMCSGTFSSQGILSSTDLSGNVDEASQDIRLTFDDSSQNSNDNILKNREEVQIGSEVKSSIQSFLDIASSDDEIENKVNNRDKPRTFKKKKVKQLVLSDDEDEAEVDNYGTEEEPVESDIENNEDEEKFIDYDSEENEVVVVNKKDLKKVAANFVDAEAELSESEWGSEDEDEEGMEKMELEDGDGEEIDEDQMRAQLGKLHARQLLDDDQRDVRMLKEMLFEDGDLHTDGSGRERKFKWRNIDKLGDETLLGPTNDDDDGNQLDPTELANELEWRKLRLEREKFLEEKLKSETDLDTLVDDVDMSSGSKLLKMGMKVLKKCKTSIEIGTSTTCITKPIVPRTVSELIGTPDGKTRALHNAMKRGSFLARGDEALARLAVMIKKSDTLDLAPKHSKNFLFTHISPSVTGEDDQDDDDNDDLENKKEENVGNNLKSARKRKIAPSGTPRTAKKPKTNSNRSSGKKLF